MPPPENRQKGQPSLFGFLGSSNKTEIKERETVRQNQKDLDDGFSDPQTAPSAAEAAGCFQCGLVWLQLQPQCCQDWVSVLRELHKLAESRTTKEEIGTDREDGGPEGVTLFLSV